MKKAGLKTFICSFVFSLFMILVVNSMFMRPRPLSSDLKIPQKNITLFLKQEAEFAGKAEIIPVKKIALRLPEKPQKPAFENIESEIPLDFGTAEEPADRPQQLLADAGSDIPLEFIDGAAPAPKARPIYNGEEGLESDHKIIKDYDIFIKKKPAIDEKAIILAQNSPLPVKGKKAEPQPQKTVQPHKAPRQPQPARPVIKSEPEKKTAAAQTGEPQLLIPLEYTSDKSRRPERKIEIAQSGNEARQVALADGSVPISSMNAPAGEAKNGADLPAPPQWETMAEKTRNSNDAWLVAKGAKHPKNSMILEQEYNKADDTIPQLSAQKTSKGEDSEIQTAEISKNLLIPIPEDIMKEKNLTPRLGSSPHNREIEERLLEKERQERGFEEDFGPEEENNTAETEKAKETENKSGGILSGITSLFKGSPKPENKNVTVIENPGESYEDGSRDIDELPDNEDTILEKIRTSFKKKFYQGKILPTEIRLAFQPNRAEISGQTLNWLEAFANKTQEDATTALEIRIDGTSSRALQQKRLNLLYNILTSKGVEYGKIKIVFTSREPNSFVIRTIKVKNDLDGGGINNTAAMQNGYYMRW